MNVQGTHGRTHETDVAIIGAGPAGLFMAFEAGMQGYKSVLLDSLEEQGGQLSALYPEKPIYDVPGCPAILAGDLVERLKVQAAPFQPVYLLGEEVVSFSREKGSMTLQTASHEVRAKVLIIAAGNGVFAPRKPPIEHLNNYENISVFYAVQGKERFRDKEVVIAGGGDSAADWAVALSDVARHVHIIHRRVDFRAAQETVRQIKALCDAGKLTLHTPCQLHGLEEKTGQSGQLEAVRIADLDGNTKTLPAQALLCFFGLLPSLGPLAQWGLGLDKKKILVTPTSMETTLSGVLAIGDIAHYEGKLELILTGFAEAAIAARTVQGIINPEKKFRLVYSTSKGLPKV